MFRFEGFMSAKKDIIIHSRVSVVQVWGLRFSDKGFRLRASGLRSSLDFQVWDLGLMLKGEQGSGKQLKNTIRLGVSDA